MFPGGIGTTERLLFFTVSLGSVWTFQLLGLTVRSLLIMLSKRVASRCKQQRSRGTRHSLRPTGAFRSVSSVSMALGGFSRFNTPTVEKSLR